MYHVMNRGDRGEVVLLSFLAGQRLRALMAACLVAVCQVSAPALGEDVLVPLQIIRVADDNGAREAHLSPLEVLGWLEYANDVYAPHGIRLTYDPLSSFTTIRSTLINSMTGISDPNWDAERRAANVAAASFPGRLVIIARWGPGSGPTGGGFSWWDYDFTVVPGYYDTYHCSHQNAKVLAHELGHHLGLPHTFGGLFDSEAAAAADLAVRGNNPAVYDGDGFSDTPPHPSWPSQECPPHTSPLILNGVPFTLPFSNIMSYYFEACALTPQQTARTEWMLKYYQEHALRLPSNQAVRNPIEAERLPVTQAQNAGLYGTQNMSGFGRDGWSGTQQLFIGFDSGGSLTVSFPVANTGLHAIELYGTLAPDFGIMECSIDGVPVGPPVDAYAPLVLPSGRISLGTNYLTAGTHLFKIQNIGKNSLSTRYSFGFDCLQLIELAAMLAPAIQMPPLSQSVDCGAHVTLSVVATSHPLPAYQWRKDGLDIVGATGTQYEIQAATTAYSGTYSVLVTNPAGSVIAGNALLTVNPRPVVPLRMEGERIPVREPQNINAYGPQQMSGFGSGWSSNAQLFVAFPPGGALNLLLWVDRAGPYALRLAATQAPDFGTFQCYLDGILSGPPIDAYATTVRPTGPIQLGIFDLHRGLHRLQIQSTGKNSLSSNYSFGVDYVELTPFDPPVIEVSRDSGLSRLVVTWNTVPAQLYQLQFNTNLSSTDWSVVTDVVAAGSSLSVTNPVPIGDPLRFYRVLVR